MMSGSDCGRVFVWDKWTGDVVNMLVGDSHVVNCVQPHPFTSCEHTIVIQEVVLSSKLILLKLDSVSKLG